MSDSEESIEFADDNIPLLNSVKMRFRKKYFWAISAFVVITFCFGCLIGVLIRFSIINEDIAEGIATLKKLDSHNKLQCLANVIKWPLQIRDLTITRNLTFFLKNGDAIKQTWHSTDWLSNIEPEYCNNTSKTDLCIKWGEERLLQVSVESKHENNDPEYHCYNIEWSDLTHSDKSLSDCFDVTNSHWYGGFENKYQHWPLEKNKVPLSPYVSNDVTRNDIGSLLERYFISSGGIGIYIDKDVPLYFSLNEPDYGNMCFSAQYNRLPYILTPGSNLKLNYKVCHSKTINDVKGIHKMMFASFFTKPNGIPHEDLFRYPIWSTWAQYFTNINQSIVLQFTKDIVERNFNCSQIEIDDGWTMHYGDMYFHPDKFPNAYEMVNKIKKLCGAVSVWVHPFFNTDGAFFKEAMGHRYLFRQVGSVVPALTQWWDGSLAGILDVSNRDAVAWYLDKLKKLQEATNVDSFKFDAGETTWVPKLYEAVDVPSNPDENYPTRYVDMAARADLNNRQEVRSGEQTQRYPIFIRQMDKSSKWGHDNGIESIIPGVFTFGILGFPFVLPDMIGGNAYGTFPESELFVRWVQLNSFLPGMQFSILPWNSKFSNHSVDVVGISLKFARLHAEVSQSLLKFAKDSVKTGEPIIRPLWWIDSTNDIALTCEDEFLVGDQYLVAPILTKGSRSRDIFIPSGTWLDMLHDNGSTVIKGPSWLYNYKVRIDELAYFQNVNYVHKDQN